MSIEKNVRFRLVNFLSVQKCPFHVPTPVLGLRYRRDMHGNKNIAEKDT